MSAPARTRATPARGGIGAGQSLLYLVVAALLLVAAAMIVVGPIGDAVGTSPGVPSPTSGCS